MLIHPMFVHFPIALLSIYSLMELMRIKRLEEKDYWFFVKATFVILGALGALLARQTGELDAKAFEGSDNAILQLHALAATATTLLFLGIAACYFILWLEREGFDKRLIVVLALSPESMMATFFRFLARIARSVIGSLGPLFAIAGLLLLTITGGLGGILVYGPDADPLTKVLYDLVLRLSSR